MRSSVCQSSLFFVVQLFSFFISLGSISEKEKKKCGDRWQWFSVLQILIISLDLTNQFISYPVFPAATKTAFLDNSGCFLTSGECLFLFLRDNERWSCLVAVHCQDIISSPPLKSSVMGAIFFPPPPPRFSISQRVN